MGTLARKAAEREEDALKRQALMKDIRTTLARKAAEREEKREEKDFERDLKEYKKGSDYHQHVANHYHMLDELRETEQYKKAQKEQKEKEIEAYKKKKKKKKKKENEAQKKKKKKKKK